MFDFIFKYFKKTEEKVETEEDRHKLRLRCVRGKWHVDEKHEVEGEYYWIIIFTSDDETEAREHLQKERSRVYNIHNGTIEYW